MAAIQCPGCKAYISASGLTHCPRCQTVMPRPAMREMKKPAPILATGANPGRPAAHAHASVPASAAPVKRKHSAMDWFAMIIIPTIVVLVLLVIYRVVVPSEAELHKRAVSAALFACQKHIHGLAEYRDADMPPYTKNWGKGDEFAFSWQRGSFHFKNGFGTAVPMSASCTGVVSTGEIRHLTLNSKDII